MADNAQDTKQAPLTTKTDDPTFRSRLYSKNRNRYKQTMVDRRIVDPRKAFTMFFINGISESDIARYYKCNRQAVNRALKPFKQVINKDNTETYKDNKSIIFDAVEWEMVSLLSDKEKQKKATLGNVAYALSNVYNINRLEQGKSTSIVEHYDLTSEEREQLNKLESMMIDQDTQDVVVEDEVTESVTDNLLNNK